MMNDAQFTRYVIGKRQAEKARAPFATAAKNALKKATAKLGKIAGCDVLSVCAFNAAGEQVNGSRAQKELEAGRAVTLKVWRCVRASADVLDAGEYEIAGEIVVKINVSGA